MQLLGGLFRKSITWTWECQDKGHGFRGRQNIHPYYVFTPLVTSHPAYPCSLVWEFAIFS